MNAGHRGGAWASCKCVIYGGFWFGRLLNVREVKIGIIWFCQHPMTDRLRVLLYPARPSREDGTASLSSPLSPPHTQHITSHVGLNGGSSCTHNIIAYAVAVWCWSVIFHTLYIISCPRFMILWQIDTALVQLVWGSHVSTIKWGSLMLTQLVVRVGMGIAHAQYPRTASVPVPTHPNTSLVPRPRPAYHHLVYK